MLFRLVSGTDLEEVCRYLMKVGGESSRRQLEHWIVQCPVVDAEAANLEEALTVLRTAGMCEGADPVRLLIDGQDDIRLVFLERLRSFERGIAGSSHPLDPWYTRLLGRLFVEPDTAYSSDLHRKANRLGLPAPLSDEKINSWRRVMEWLGVGRRLGAGFMAVHSVTLVRALLTSWGKEEGSIQEWLDDHVERFLPVRTAHGDLPRAIIQPLLCLEASGSVELIPRQDSPGKSYLGPRRAKWLRLRGGVQ